jgi:hypothetical protein
LGGSRLAMCPPPLRRKLVGTLLVEEVAMRLRGEERAGVPVAQGAAMVEGSMGEWGRGG